MYFICEIETCICIYKTCEGNTISYFLLMPAMTDECDDDFHSRVASISYPAQQPAPQPDPILNSINVPVWCIHFM